jgi:hypothetical protein
MGVLPAKPLHHIIGGLLTFESDWNPPLGKSLIDALAGQDKSARLDLALSPSALRGDAHSASLRDAHTPVVTFAVAAG